MIAISLASTAGARSDHERRPVLDQLHPDDGRAPGGPTCTPASGATADFGAYAACMQILDNFTMVASILVAGIAPAYVCESRLCGSTCQHRPHRAGHRRAGPCRRHGHRWLRALDRAPLYGNAFEATVTLLRVAAVASTLVFADVALTLLAVYLRRPRWVAIKWALVFGATLAFDLIVIPRYGSWGAIAGYALGNGVAVLVGLTLWWRHRPAPEVASSRYAAADHLLPDRDAECLSLARNA
jgi:PST family polysaccharide transporter